VRNGQPAGTPIGRALDIPAGIAYDSLREVVAAIDRVHGDGDLPSIPVRFVTGMAGRGRFRFDEVSGPISITLRTDQSHAGLTLVHEVGHLIDLAAFGEGRRFGSTDHTLLAGWRRAVAERRAHRTLNAMVRARASELSLADGTRQVVILEEDELVAVRRSLRMEELWACSYAQFVTTESGLSTLVKSLETLRTRPIAKVYYPRQWDDDDFGPIETATDTLMVRLEWRS
jgi:hypothetical protein